MVVRQLTTSVELGAQFPADLHDILEHLVVVLACEKDLPCIQLIQGATNRPHIDRIVEGDAQDDLGSTIEAADQVRHRLVGRHGRIRTINCRTQVANLEHISGLVDLRNR